MTKLFTDLGLSDAVLAAVNDMGYTTPTPVQEQAIPVALEGKDVIATAKTGTGKTAAFALPILNNLPHGKNGEGPRALILSPTRELAQQSGNVCHSICGHTHHHVLTVVGGTKYGPQINSLKRGIDVLIATPGRLIDLMKRGVVDLRHIEVIVLDEADRMLDMGFWPAMETIVGACPEQHQTLLFSATISKPIQKKVTPLLNDPTFIEIAHHGETADTVDQYVMAVTQKQKPELLNAVLREKGADRVIVFTRTRRGSDSCSSQLRRDGFFAESINSDKSQRERRRALDNFSKGKTNILVATDVLARGIDVSDVDQVINYDLPEDAEDYVHRIGRTGRAGERGFAVSFVSPDTMWALRDIEKLISCEIPSMPLEGFDTEVTNRRAGKKSSGRRSGNGRKNTQYRKSSGARNEGARRNGDAKRSGEKKRVPSGTWSEESTHTPSGNRAGNHGRNGHDEKTYGRKNGSRSGQQFGKASGYRSGKPSGQRHDSHSNGQNAHHGHSNAQGASRNHSGKKQAYSSR